MAICQNNILHRQLSNLAENKSEEKIIQRLNTTLMYLFEWRKILKNKISSLTPIDINQSQMSLGDDPETKAARLHKPSGCFTIEDEGYGRQYQRTREQEDFKLNKLSNSNTEKRPMDSLSIPNLVDHFQGPVKLATKNGNHRTKADHGNFSGHININDLSFTTSAYKLFSHISACLSKIQKYCK